jgi:arylformamidase
MGTWRAWLDVTVPVRQGMVRWPDNPAVRVESNETVASGIVCRVTKLTFGVHTGTHVDAPNHFGVPGGGVDELPLQAFLGDARVVSVTSRTIGRSEMEALDLQAGERVLFKTSNSARCWNTDDFVPDYVYVTSEGARVAAARRVQTVGIDYLSVGGGNDGPQTHRVLLEAGVCILEGLDLRSVEPGQYELLALPMLIAGSDGAPTRVVLRPR